MTELLSKQFEFVRLVGKFIDWVYTQGYTLSAGEMFRTPEQAKWNADHGKGISHSLHMDRLAWDFQLFKDGKLLTTLQDYEPLGKYWESLGGSWGGRFGPPIGPDCGHISLAWQGRR